MWGNEDPGSWVAGLGTQVWGALAGIPAFPGLGQRKGQMEKGMEGRVNAGSECSSQPSQWRRGLDCGARRGEWKVGGWGEPGSLWIEDV